MSDLNKEDLTLLLDSYRKQVELNTQVLTQQQNLIMRMDSMIEIHKETCHNINKVSEKVEHQDRNTLEGFIKIADKLGSNRKDEMKEHGDLKVRLYIAFGFMSVIILNIIAIYFK